MKRVPYFIGGAVLVPQLVLIPRSFLGGWGHWHDTRGSLLKVQPLLYRDSDVDIVL